MRTRRYVLALVVATLAASPVQACTLWSAAGDSAHGGTILAKNRDFAPDSTGKLKLVHPEGGHPFLGYYAMVKGHERLVAGVNDAGLTLVSATAGSVPRERREVASSVKSLLGRILAQTSTVEEALSHEDWFAGHAPVIYMLSDGSKTAWVEIAPGGHVATRVAGNGMLAHTNHFIAPELADANVKTGPSSQARLERISKLLDGQNASTLDDFERFGDDRTAGPDNSIFRVGSKPDSTRTMARFLVRNEPGKSPVAWVTGYDDPGKPWSVKLTLDEAFWGQVPEVGMKLLAPAKE